VKPSSYRPVFWSLAGLFLLGFAGWEVVQLTRGRRKAFDALLPPPLRSRSGERPSLVREAPTADPVANYLARAKRGMTEQEVRWMLEDFEAAGLDIDLKLQNPSGYRNLREKQQRWYLAALREALSLSDMQVTQAAQRLTDLLNRDEKNYWLHADEPDVLNENTGVGCRLLDYLQPECWLQDTCFAPWALCELTAAQLSLTWKSGADHANRVREVAIWMLEPQLLPVIQDPITGNEQEFYSKDQKGRGGQIPYYLRGSTIFPLTPDQQRMASFSANWMAQCKVCQPAQLRMAFLLDAPFTGFLTPDFLSEEP